MGEREPQYTPGEKQPNRPTRREFLKTLGVGGLSFLTVSSAAADALEEALKILTVKIGKGALEKKETESMQARLLEETRKLNKNFKLTLPREPRILLEEIRTTVGGRRYSWRYPLNNELIAGLLQNSLQETFGGTEVVDRRKLRQETAERREDRVNPEIDQTTLPETATIKREDAEVDLYTDFITSAKDLEAYFGKLGKTFSLKGFDFEKNKALAISRLVFRDAAAQTQNDFIMLGGLVDYNKTEINAILGRSGIRYRERTNKQEENYYGALSNAFENTRTILQELKKSGNIVVQEREGNNQ